MRQPGSALAPSALANTCAEPGGGGLGTAVSPSCFMRSPMADRPCAGVAATAAVLPPHSVFIARTAARAAVAALPGVAADAGACDGITARGCRLLDEMNRAGGASGAAGTGVF